MSVKKIVSHEYHCDSKGCNIFKASTGGRPQDWGMVRIFDNKHDRTSIGDQNGWNNYDLCPEHYRAVLKNMGIEAHNIPQVPDDEP